MGGILIKARVEYGNSERLVSLGLYHVQPNAFFIFDRVVDFAPRDRLEKFTLGERIVEVGTFVYGYCIRLQGVIFNHKLDQ
jgi:hypothetical protein